MRAAAVTARPPIELTEEEIARLVLATYCHSDTIRNWARGERVRRTTNMRLEHAMMKLGIEFRLRAPRAKTLETTPRRRIVSAA